MKKQLLALASVAFLFTACSKKDNNAQPEEASFTGLLKGVYSKTDSVRFEYNNDKTLSRFTYGWIDGPNNSDVGGGIQSAKYANGKLTQLWLTTYAEDLKYGPNQLNMEMAYASDGKLQKILGYDTEGKDNIYDSIGYNAAGKIEKVFHYSGPKGQKAVNTQIEFVTWTGNNITKVVHQYINGETITESTDEYTFDDKENYMASAGLAAMEDMFTPEVFNANNVTKQTFKRANYPDDVSTYTYEYNGQKAVKMTLTETKNYAGSEPKVYTTVSTIEYYK